MKITLQDELPVVSGLLAGYLADRAGSRPIFLVSHLLMTPALLVMLWLPGSWIYAGVSGNLENPYYNLPNDTKNRRFSL